MLIKEICDMRREHKMMVDALAHLYLQMNNKKFVTEKSNEEIAHYVMDIVKRTLNDR